jgi:hypothetical protein
VGSIGISGNNLLSLNRTTEGYVQTWEEQGGGYAAMVKVYLCGVVYTKYCA